MSEATAAARRTLTRARRLATPALIVSTVYFGVLVYAPLRLATLLAPDWRPGTPELLVLIVLPVAGRIAYELRPGAISRRVAAVSLTWLGSAFLLFFLLLPWELAAAARDVPARDGAAALGALWGGLVAVGLVNAQLVHVRRLRLPLAGLERPLRLAQITDLHIGSRAPGFLARVARRVAREAPDVVVVTGDLVDFRDVPQSAYRPLAALPAPVFACLGNHERYVDTEAICRALAGAGVRVLRDACARHGELVLVGLDDGSARHRVRDGLLALAPLPEGPRILLYHRPDGLEDAAGAGIDLMLAGHTHAGQIVPFNFVVKRVYPRLRGLHRHGATRLYVSPGTGTWGPLMRLGSRNEITLLELVPAAADAAPGS